MKQYRSVLQNIAQQERCYFCHKPSQEWHHIFNASFKKKSEKYGAMVRLCHMCHNEPPNEQIKFEGGVHFNKEKWDKLRVEAQYKIMAEQGWTVEQWRSEFEKNYL